MAPDLWFLEVNFFLNFHSFHRYSAAWLTGMFLV